VYVHQQIYVYISNLLRCTCGNCIINCIKNNRQSALMDKLLGKKIFT